MPTSQPACDARGVFGSAAVVSCACTGTADAISTQTNSNIRRVMRDSRESDVAMLRRRLRRTRATGPGDWRGLHRIGDEAHISMRAMNAMTAMDADDHHRLHVVDARRQAQW